MKTSYCRWAMLLSAGCLLLLCGLAIGGDKDREAFVPRPDRMRVGLDVLVDGEPLRTITHRGRIYLPVPRMGAEYQIRVWNHGPRRIALSCRWMGCQSSMAGPPPRRRRVTS